MPGARVDLAFEGAFTGETLGWSALSYERGHETGVVADTRLFEMRFEGEQAPVPTLPSFARNAAAVGRAGCFQVTGPRRERPIRWASRGARRR